MELVKITWLDAQDHRDTWVGEKDAEAFADSECVIISVGFLVKRGRKYISLGSDWDEDDKDYGTVRRIPIGMIQSIEPLEIVKPG